MAFIPNKGSFKGRLVLTLAALTSLLLLGGHWFYSNLVGSLRTQVEGEITAISNLKLRQIIEWREERLSDALIVMQDSSFNAALQKWDRSRHRLGKQQMLGQLKMWLNDRHYTNALFLDTSGAVQLAIEDAKGLTLSSLVSPLRGPLSGIPVLSNVHHDPPYSHPTIDLIIPVGKRPSANRRPLGLVVLVINAERSLYPLLLSWPLPSRTSEAILVSQRGDSALFLNELRHRKNSALRLGFHLSQLDVPAVQAALGKTGIFYGKDYRGVEVLSYTQPVPDSPWSLVSKTDVDEAFEKSKKEVTLGMVTIALLSLVILGFVTAAWKELQRRQGQTRLEADERIRESEEVFRNVMTHSGTGISLLTPEGTYVKVNPALCAMLGYSEPELMQLKMQAISHPDDRAADEENIRRLLSREILVGEREKRYFHKDGHLLHVRVIGSVVWNRDGTCRYLISQVVDTTKGKRAEQAVHAALELNRRMDSLSVEGMMQFCLDEAERITESQVGFFHFVNEDQEHLELIAWSSRTKGYCFFPPADQRHYPISQAGVWVDCFHKRKAVIHNDYASLPNKKGLPAGHSPLTRETVVPVMDGERVVAIIGVGNKATNYTDDDADILTLLAKNTWVSIQRKRADGQIIKERDFSQAVLETAGSLIVVMDSAGRIVRFNKTAETMTGYTEQEVKGAHVWDHFIVQDEVDAVREVFSALTSGRLARKHANHWRMRDGVLRLIDWSNTFLLNSKGEIEHVVSIGIDITEERRLEEERQRYAAELARSNQELEHFAYVASHDLQEPLRMVSSYTQLLARRYKDKLDQDAREFIEFAVDGAARMQTMIKSLLQYSRTSREQVSFGPVDTMAVVQQALRNLKLVLEESKATIELNLLPTISGQEALLVQLFQNLVGNALKFRKRDVPPHIHIGATVNSHFSEFSVRDNGIGIEKQYFDRIFLIFQRLHVVDEYAGTGIGLALCRKIVERHGGRIWLESTPDAGTTFFFTLPVVQ